MQFESGSSSKTLKGVGIERKSCRPALGQVPGAVVSISVRRVYKCLYSAEAEAER